MTSESVESRIISCVVAFLLCCCLLPVSAGQGGRAYAADATQGAAHHGGKPLRFGVIPQLSAVQMVRLWQPFVDYLSGEIGRPVELVLKTNYEEVINGLEHGEMDFALLGSFAYVQARAQLQVKPLVKRIINNSPFYHSVIIVRKDGAVTSLDELKSKAFAFTDKDSTTGYFLPYSMLRNRFGTPEQYFSEVLYTGNHDSAILAVHNGTVAAASISTTRWNPANPRIKDLAIIWKSEPIPLGPIVVKRDMASATVAKLRRACEKFGTGESGALRRQVGVDGFLPATDREYDLVRGIMKSFKHTGTGE